jgi:hypothetical protein
MFVLTHILTQENPSLTLPIRENIQYYKDKVVLFSVERKSVQQSIYVIMQEHWG